MLSLREINLYLYFTCVKKSKNKLNEHLFHFM